LPSEDENDDKKSFDEKNEKIFKFNNIYNNNNNISKKINHISTNNDFEIVEGLFLNLLCIYLIIFFC
jgi:hypothetical protein